MAEEARVRIDKMLKARAALSEVDRMCLERLSFVEDEQGTDANASDTDYERMLDGYRKRGMLRSLPTLYRSCADFLARAGRTLEAIPMQERAITLSEANAWTLHVPMLLARLAMMHDKLGDRGSASRCWEKIDRLIAEAATSPRDLPESRRMSVALQQLDWLERNGRAGEARSRLAELRQSARREELSDLTLTTLDGLTIAELEAETENPSVSAAELIAVVIEPLATQSVIERRGVPPRTRFSLLNPNAVPVAGTLRVSGVPLLLRRSSGAAVILELGRGEGEATLPISLVAQERLVIEASSVAESCSCNLEWVVDGEVLSRAEWLVSAEPNSGWTEPVQGTTASIVRRSRFYAAPLFQEIRWTREMEGQVKNFRVRTSTKAWVSYEAPDSQPIAVDVNGDGDFEDAGDSISAGFDSDHNLIPDAISGDGLGVFGFEVFVYPSGGEAEATMVEFELLENDGSWRVSASNQLRRVARSASR